MQNFRTFPSALSAFFLTWPSANNEGGCGAGGMCPFQNLCLGWRLCCWRLRKDSQLHPYLEPFSCFSCQQGAWLCFWDEVSQKKKFHLHLPSYLLLPFQFTEQSAMMPDTKENTSCGFLAEESGCASSHLMVQMSSLSFFSLEGLRSLSCSELLPSMTVNFSWVLHAGLHLEKANTHLANVLCVMPWPWVRPPATLKWSHETILLFGRKIFQSKAC